MLIVVANKDVFIYVNYLKHSKQLTRSLLQQMIISIITVLLLPQQTTSLGSLHARMFSPIIYYYPYFCCRDNESYNLQCFHV